MQKRSIISCLLAVMLGFCLLATGIVSAPVNAKTTGISLAASNEKGKPGDKITITVSLKENPGVAYLGIPISYDHAVLEKESFQGTGLSGWTIGDTAVWVSADNSKYTGTILKLNFRIKKGATAGKTSVKLEPLEAWSANEKAVAGTVTNGTVTIEGTSSKTDSSSKTTAPAKKSKQSLKVLSKNPTVKRSRVKSNKQVVDAITVKNARGAVTYKKTNHTKRLSVDKKTGKITVKKGTKKGRYKIQVKVTAKGTAKYKAASKKVNVIVTVK